MQSVFHSPFGSSTLTEEISSYTIAQHQNNFRLSG